MWPLDWIRITRRHISISAICRASIRTFNAVPIHHIPQSVCIPASPMRAALDAESLQRVGTISCPADYALQMCQVAASGPCKHDVVWIEVRYAYRASRHGITEKLSGHQQQQFNSVPLNLVILSQNGFGVFWNHAVIILGTYTRPRQW